MLEIKKLSVKYHNEDGDSGRTGCDSMAVRDASFAVEEREIVGIVGESGSGKTTLIRSIMSLLGERGAIARGEILFRGQNLSRLSEQEMRRIRGRDIGMIFQHPELSLNPVWTIKKLFYESMRVHGAVTKREASARGIQLLQEMSLDDAEGLLDAYPFELSGGMCQRVAIAIAMINRPQLLLADEPTSALDVTVQSQVIESMMRMREKFGTSVLIVSHNMGVIARMADKVGVMYCGQLVEWGRKDEVLRFPKHDYTKAMLKAVPRIAGATVCDGEDFAHE